MELTHERASELAERITQLGPWTCGVHFFADDDGVYQARVLVQLGDPIEPDLLRVADQLRELAALIEAEGLKVASAETLGLVLAHRDAEP